MSEKMSSSSSTQVRSLESLWIEGEPALSGLLSEDWQVRVISSSQCLSYMIWNLKTKEALLVDPKKEDEDAYIHLHRDLSGYLWLGVVDTHTHADHISGASRIAKIFNAPLLMHHLSPSARVDLRVVHQVALPSHAGPIHLIPTPGHTPDSLCILWGSLLFTGDTVLFGDVGRDDLPGGNPVSHFESLETLKGICTPQTLVLPGHDHRGGRMSTWATQLKLNSSLTQGREEFVEECLAFDAPAPELLKKALAENFK